MENETNRGKYFIPKEPSRQSLESYKRLNGLKEQLEWVKRQLEYASFANEYKMRLACKRGEIYEFDWGINVNAEFSSRHYGVVLKDSNEFDPLVLVCPLKTNKNGPHPASDIDLGYIKDLQSTHKTLAVVNQARSLDKMRIFSKTAIGDSDLFDNEIPKLEPAKLKLLLTAYYNFIFVDDIKNLDEESRTSQK